MVLPLANNPASRIALFTWALATGVSYLIPRSDPPWTRRGAVCSGPSATIVAPICRSGVMTRSIGRLESDESPTRRLSNFWPASKPAISRIVVAEFPQLMSPAGGLRTRFFPWTIIVFGSGSSIRIPSALSPSTVRMQSFALRNPSSRQTPLESAAIIAARWEMLLSPGTVISVSICGARLTRSSMFCYSARIARRQTR